MLLSFPSQYKKKFKSGRSLITVEMFFPVSFPCNCQQLDLTVTSPKQVWGQAFRSRLSSVPPVCVSVIYKLYISVCACVCECGSPARSPPWPRSWFLAQQYPDPERCCSTRAKPHCPHGSVIGSISFLALALSAVRGCSSANSSKCKQSKNTPIFILIQVLIFFCKCSQCLLYRIYLTNSCI